MLPSELLKRIRRIQIRTSHMVSEALGGQYRSAFAGRGMEFEEVRPYQIGDDVRAIDWNVSARTGEPYIKLFREERELTVMLLVDMSASQRFGTRGQLKSELVAELAATIAFSAIRNNDKVGLMCFTDRVEKMVPVRKGSSHVLRIIRELLVNQSVGRGTSIGAALDELNRTHRKRAVVFIISDFLDAGFERSLRIARTRHDIIPVVVSDEFESTLPEAGLVEFLDLESGRVVVVDTSSKGVRRRFAEAAEQRVAARLDAFRRMKVDPIELRTDRPFTEPLTRYFRRREARRQR
jgi:uncharacterized protein (DUF58 family)